jgi:glycosyltransferase involved in cell wall biosynthesis
MRVALLRGDSLNRYEMQSYEPLLGEWEFAAFTSYDNPFDLDGIKIPIQRVHASSELFRVFPSRLRRYADFAMRHVLELHAPFVNLVEKLKGFDIIHSADAHYYYSYQAIQAKKRYGSKVVITQWENVPFLFEQRSWARRRKRETLANADLFFAVTERAKETLMLEGVPEKKIRVIPVGIDLSRFQPAERDSSLRAALGIDAKDQVILYVGRLVRSKGLLELLYAFTRLLRDPDMAEQSIRLTCVGPGNQNLVAPMLERLGIANQVVFAGSFTYDKMPMIHNLADVFVLPSVPTYRWREQFGMVLLESMACGKAVISTRSGSIPEVVGDAGILVQPYDHLSLYEALKKILLNESLRQRLGQKARARVEAYFDCRSVAKKIDEAYRSVLK